MKYQVKHRELSVEIKFTIAAFVLLVFRFIMYAPTACSDYIGLQYLLSYKYGFIARGFVGTLLEPLHLYLTRFKLTCICLFVEILMSAVYLIFVWKGLKHAREKNKIVAGCLILIFTMSPMSPAFTYALSNFGRFDAILIMISLMQCLLMMNPSTKRGTAVCILSAIGMCVHPQYVFTYFMSGALLLLYWVAQDEHHRGKWIVLFIINAALTVSLFFFFEFLRPIGAGWTQETMFQSIQAKTNLDASGAFYQYLDDWYFGSVESHLANNQKPFPAQKYTFVLTLFFMLPYEISYYWIWWKGLKETRIVWRKVFFIALMLSFLITIPCFVIMIDYGRYYVSIYFAQMLILIYLLCIGDNKVEEKIHDISFMVRKKYPVAASIFILFCTNLGCFKDIASIDIVSQSYTLLTYWIGVICSVM